MAVLQRKYGYDASRNGLKLVAKDNSATVVTSLPTQTNADGYFAAGVEAVKDGSVVVLTGVYVYFDEYTRYYFARNGGAIATNIFGGASYDGDTWREAGYGTKSATYSDSAANRLIQKIINNNITIGDCNIITRTSNSMSINNDVVKFFIDYMKNLQEEYNFDDEER